MATNTETSFVPAGGNAPATETTKPGRRQRRAAIGTSRLPHPESTTPPKILWPYCISLGLYHALALLAFLPWLFSWTGVTLTVLGLVRVRNLGHQPLLPPSADTPWPRLPVMVGARFCGAGHLLSARHARPLGVDPPDAPSVFRRTARSAQPAGQVLLGSHGLVAGRKSRAQQRADLRPLRARCAEDPFYFAFERNLLWFWVNLAQGVLFYPGWVRRRLGDERPGHGGRAVWPEPVGLGRHPADGAASGTSPGA